MRKPSHNWYDTAHIYEYRITTHTEGGSFRHIYKISSYNPKGGGGKRGGNVGSAIPHFEGRDMYQFTSASEAIVLLANEEPLPLLLCRDGLYGPVDVGLVPLGLSCGKGGVWGLIC